MKSDSIVIIPTYNEKENIERIINIVFSLEKEFDILVVDDNSPDGTANIVRKIQEKYTDRLHLLNRAGKLGLATAYIDGFRWSIKKQYDYMFEMDADFSHNPTDLIPLYNACKIDGGDLSIGSRYKTGVNVVNWPMKRVLMSYFASKYVRFITGMNICDTTAGFICYTRNVLEYIDFDRIKFKGYGFQIEMKFLAWKMGFNIIEVPIIFTDRRNGVSKMSGGIFSEALWGVFMMKMSSYFKKYKQYDKNNN